MKLSAIILAKNEESNMGRAVASVSFCDEIIVVDDGSTDATAKRAEETGRGIVRVIRYASAWDFAAQRNWAMEQARHDWILFIDADEEVAGELKNEILGAMQKENGTGAYYIKRRDFFWGRGLKYGDLWNAYRSGIIRLMKKGSGTWKGNVHEVFHPVSGTTKRLASYLNHYPHQTVSEFIRDVNGYSTIRSRELADRGVKPGILALIALPLCKFIWNYLLKLGFLDGAAGFAYAFLMSFHSFLVRAKLFQYQAIDSDS
jgi:glycosyltransferase involved in cell wall biosynthesis